MRFSRSTKATSGRHRTPPGGPQGADLTADHELETYLDALAPNRDPECTDPGRRFGDAKVYQVRLPSSAEEQVHWLAERYGTSPLTLLQGWILQRLHHESGGQGFGAGQGFGGEAGEAGAEPRSRPAEQATESTGPISRVRSAPRAGH